MRNVAAKTPLPIASPLSRKATLVAVTVKQWTARKLDKKVTDETNRKYGASKDAGRYNKLLIAGEHLAELNRLVSLARDTHYALTLPWTDKGPRILPNALYSKFTDAFRNIRRDFERAADAFSRGYPAFVAEREDKLNGLYDPKDYPAPNMIRAKFRMDTTIMPFPDAGDFRSDLDADTVADIRREIEQSSERVMADAMSHTAERIIEVVGHMAEKLKEYQPRGSEERTAARKAGVPRTRFHASLVGNIRELGELLPAFNLTNDAKLTAITQRIVKELCAEEVDELRDNARVREAVTQSADEIVEAMQGFLA
jgi:hypothetical protein